MVDVLCTSAGGIEEDFIKVSRAWYMPLSPMLYASKYDFPTAGNDLAS